MSWQEDRDSVIDELKETPLHKKIEAAISKIKRRGSKTFKIFDYVNLDPRDNKSPHVDVFRISHET
jgi:hypothetical protein